MTFQICCPNCETFLLTLVQVDDDEENLLYLQCDNCGLYFVFNLEKNIIIDLGTKKTITDNKDLSPN